VKAFTPEVCPSSCLMISEILAVLATTLSLFTSLPQLRKSLRLGRRHQLPVTAVTGSLLVAGSWFVWSLRTGQTGALVGSLFGVLTHVALLCRAEGPRHRSLFSMPALTVSAIAPIHVVEGLTSALAIAVLVPHLRAAWSVPHEIAVTRWLLEASEELLWGLWAISIAAPMVAAPNALYVPVCLIIAWRAGKATQPLRSAVVEEKTRQVTRTHFATRHRFNAVIPVVDDQRRATPAVVGVPPPIYA